MVLHHHLIDCASADLRNEIMKCFGDNDHRRDDVRKMSQSLFDITDEQRRYLTTIDTSKYRLEKLFLLAGEKSRLLIENGPYEWSIHKRMASAYTKDSEFGNVFGWIDRAINKHDLHCLHGGGVSTFDALIDMEEKECYPDGVFAKKHVIVFDRDTDSATKYDPNQNTLLKRLCGKKSGQVTEQDVYTLDQQPYIWHVWYKRAIENYFTDEQYEKCGVNMRDFRYLSRDREKRDYYNLGEELKSVGYHKSQMAHIAKEMKMKDFERGLHTFDIEIDGETRKVSEFQLLLLKIARII
jgi:hypothetical protein